MSEYSRKEFLGIGGALAAGFGVGGWQRGDGGRGPFDPGAVLRGEAEPDLVLLDGTVYTVDDRLPRAEAFAVKDGRFVAVGSSDDVRNLAGPNTRVIDAAGMTVTPGFIDCHTHPSGTSELFDVWLADVRTIGKIQELLAEEAADTPPGHWVVGSRYDDTKVVDETIGEYRRITRWDLDEAVPDRPVRVTHRGGHIAWYNSRALELAGIDESVENPPDGRFARDDRGRLTGLVEGGARSVFSGIAEDREYSRADRQAGVSYLSGRMASTGLTSVHATGGGSTNLIALQDAYEAGELYFRMYQFMSGGGSAYQELKDAGVRSGFGDEWVRLGAVKYASDGSNSGRTMSMSTPYPGRPDDYGILYMTQEEIHEVVEEAHRADWHIGIHANGDVAIDMVLNAYERAQRNWPREDPRHRIEHCTLVNPDLLRRIRDGGVVPTPFWTYVYYHGDKWVEYGEELTRWMWAHRSFLDYDIPVAGASDYVPGPYEPMMAIQAMVTRTDLQGRTWGANQRISVDEALRIGTINGAHASFEEDLKGSITPGKLADFVVLAEDPHEVDPFDIIDIEVVRTEIGGKTVHEA